MKSASSSLPNAMMNNPFTRVAAYCPMAPFLAAPFFWNPPAWIILLMNPPTSRLARLAFALTHPWLPSPPVRDPRLSHDRKDPLPRASAPSPHAANDNEADAQRLKAQG